VALALMVDLSSNNPAPDLKAHWDAGYRVLCLKVTEGTGYAWTASHRLAAEWHSFGLDAVVWHYHFLHPGTTASGAKQADWFWAHVRGDLRAGDRVVCDVETAGETGGEVAAFWARYVTHDPRTPRVDYGSPYFLRDHGIRPQHGEALWLAQYAARVSFIPPGWTSYLAWQYTQTARGVPGMRGAVDQSHLKPAALPASLHLRITAENRGYFTGEWTEVPGATYDVQVDDRIVATTRNLHWSSNPIGRLHGKHTVRVLATAPGVRVWSNPAVVDFP
jgi:GH25 family lysozyme M1 (1,4-beta-N-acetylmuramidase)